MTSVFPTTPINICSLLSFGKLFVLIIPLALRWDSGDETPGSLLLGTLFIFKIPPELYGGSRGETPVWEQPSFCLPDFSGSGAFMSCCSRYQVHPGGWVTTFPSSLSAKTPSACSHSLLPPQQLVGPSCRGATPAARTVCFRDAGWQCLLHLAKTKIPSMKPEVSSPCLSEHHKSGRLRQGGCWMGFHLTITSFHFQLCLVKF